MTQLVSIALFLSPLINTNGVFNSLQGVYIIMTNPKIMNINLADRELQAACKRGSAVTSAELEL